MPQVPNKLMPWLQAIAAMTLILVFCFAMIGPMFKLDPADESSKKTLDNIMLILVGFLFGSAVSSARKDDQTAALVAQVMPAAPPAAPLPGAAPLPVKIDDSTPVKVDEVKKP